MEENKVSTGAAKSENCQMEVQDSHNEHPPKSRPDAPLELAEGMAVEQESSESESTLGEGAVVEQESNSESESTLGDVNMEASLTVDDVEVAGGLGLRDDISSFLPVAMDCTDFEASLRDAREFEGPQDEIPRPGLGWTEPSEPEGEIPSPGLGWTEPSEPE